MPLRDLSTLLLCVYPGSQTSAIDFPDSNFYENSLPRIHGIRKFPDFYPQIARISQIGLCVFSARPKILEAKNEERERNPIRGLFNEP